MSAKALGQDVWGCFDLLGQQRGPRLEGRERRGDGGAEPEARGCAGGKVERACVSVSLRRKSLQPSYPVLEPHGFCFCLTELK